MCTKCHALQDKPPSLHASQRGLKGNTFHVGGQGRPWPRRGLKQQIEETKDVLGAELLGPSLQDCDSTWHPPLTTLGAESICCDVGRPV